MKGLAVVLTNSLLGILIAGCGTSHPQANHHHLDKATQAVGQALAWVRKQPHLHVPLEGPRWLPQTSAALSDNVTASSTIQQYSVGIFQTRKRLGLNNPALRQIPNAFVGGWSVERSPGKTSRKSLATGGLWGIFIVPMGSHSPVPLGRITGQAYSGGREGQDHAHVPLVTWTEHGWIWEVIAPSPATAAKDASHIAAMIRRTALPVSEGAGFVNFKHGPSITLTWVRAQESVLLQSGAPSTHSVADTLKMASSWKTHEK